MVFYLMKEEMLEIGNSDGFPVGLGRRSEIHGKPALFPKVIHVLVFYETGELLQKRSMNKDVAPGKGDTSVGGHFSLAESPIIAAQRETE